MVPDASPSEPSAPPVGSKRRSRWKIALAVLGIVTIAAFIFEVVHPSRIPDLVWLAGKPIPSIAKQSLLSKTRLQIIRITYPLWQRFYKLSPRMYTSARLLSLTAVSADRLASSLGAAVSTNANGFRAWILTAPEVKALEGLVLTLPEMVQVTPPRLMTPRGTDARISAVAQGSNNFLVNLSPKISGKSIRLRVGAEWVQTAPSRMTNTLICRALIPNGGALLVERGGKKDHDPSYVVILSATRRRCVWKTAQVMIRFPL